MQITERLLGKTQAEALVHVISSRIAFHDSNALRAALIDSEVENVLACLKLPSLHDLQDIVNSCKEVYTTRNIWYNFQKRDKRGAEWTPDDDLSEWQGFGEFVIAIKEVLMATMAQEIAHCIGIDPCLNESKWMLTKGD